MPGEQYNPNAPSGVFQTIIIHHAIMVRVSDFPRVLREARDIMERGGFREAFQRIADVPVSRPDELFEKIALMADAGVALRDVSVLEYGLYLMERHERDILAVPAFAPFHWLNLAHLKANLSAVREFEGEGRCWYDRRRTAPAREAYRRAATCAGGDAMLKARILTAHGRLLAGLGRDWEAFALFCEACGCDPRDAEARLGRIESLVSLSGTAPALERDLLREARGRLAAFRSSREAAARGEQADALESRIAAVLGPDDAEGEPAYPRNTVVTSTEREHTMVMYSLKHRLYLSPCSACLGCDRAVGDSAALGAAHAVVGAKVADRYRRTATLIGRLTERYRALRAALVDHHRGAEIPDGADHGSHMPEVEGWIPASSAAVTLVSSLAGTRGLLEGMAACIALYLGREISPPVRIDHILGTPAMPGAGLNGVKNPGLHGFWDLWADGAEGLVPGAELVDLFGDSLSSPRAEELILDSSRLSDEALGLIGWLGNLIGCLVRMTDRDARGETDDPPIWPLQSFVMPRR